MGMAPFVFVTVLLYTTFKVKREFSVLFILWLIPTSQFPDCHVRLHEAVMVSFDCVSIMNLVTFSYYYYSNQ